MHRLDWCILHLLASPLFIASSHEASLVEFRIYRETTWECFIIGILSGCSYYLFLRLRFFNFRISLSCSVRYFALCSPVFGNVSLAVFGRTRS